MSDFTLYGADLSRAETPDAVNSYLSDFRSSTGDVLFQQFALGMQSGPLNRINQFASELGAEPGRELSAEEANRQYGIPGHLTFSSPIDEAVANMRRQAMDVEIARKNVAASGRGGFVEGVGGITVGLSTALLDPISAGAALLPVGRIFAAGRVLEATIAARAAQTGTVGALEALGARAALGAAEGAIGTAPVAGIQYALAAEQGREYTMGDALSEILTGAALGGVLRVGGGLVADAWRGWSGKSKTDIATNVLSDLMSDTKPNPADAARMLDPVLEAQARAGRRFTDEEVMNHMATVEKDLSNLTVEQKNFYETLKTEAMDKLKTNLSTAKPAILNPLKETKPAFKVEKPENLTLEKLKSIDNIDSLNAQHQEIVNSDTFKGLKEAESPFLKEYESAKEATANVEKRAEGFQEFLNCVTGII